jgi:anti-sigma B factor antagonist
MPWQPRQHLKVENVDDVIVVRFEDDQINSEDSVRRIGEQLNGLVESREGIKLLIDFSGVPFVSSSMLAKLVHLKKKSVATQGQVKLCCLAPYLRTVFEISHLDRLLAIYVDEQAALDAFQGIHHSTTSLSLDIGTDEVAGE